MRILFLWLCVSVAIPASAQTESSSEHVLLVATVSAARYTGDESYLIEESGHPVFIDRFSATLRNLRVVEGTYDPPTSLKVDLRVGGLRATGRKRFPSVSEIYVVLKLGADGPVVATWGEIVRVVCLDENELEEYGLGETFSSDYQRTFGGGADCTHL
jgi:hypothetical protein